MELLYLLDRLITSSLQIFCRFVERKLHIKLHFQIPLLSLFIVVFIMTGVIGEYDEVFPGLPLILTLFSLFFWDVVAVPFEFLLQRLHVYFDYEGAYRTDKTYENGYKCWSGVIASMIFIILTPVPFLGWYFGASGFMQLTLSVYQNFVVRRKGPGNRKKFSMSTALEALLERCRDFIPAPKPIPEAS